MDEKKNGQELKPYIHTDGARWAGFFIDARTGILTFERKIAGKHIKFSTRETNPTKARAIANRELETRLGTKKQKLRLLINEELDLFQKVKDAEPIDERTKFVVRNSIKQIRPYWGEMLPSEINADTVAGWMEWWKTNREGLQMENAIKYFKNFCFYLSRKVHGGLPVLAAVPRIQDPNRKKVRQMRKRKTKRIFTKEEFKRVIETAPDEEAALAVLIMRTMATRIEETLTMAFDREIFLDESSGVYRWREGQNKADHEGEHDLHPVLLKPLRALQVKRNDMGTDLLFPQKFDRQAPLKSQQIDWDAWRKSANLGWHWTSKTCRHTALSELFDSGLPQFLVCKLYRISAKEAMETYYKPTDRGREMARAILEVSV